MKENKQKKCDCYSYNAATGTTPNVILNSKDYFDWKERTVCVDDCIAEQIKALWAAGIWTDGSCCGHNKDKPSVVIGQGQSPEKAHKILKNFDNREWKVLQWQLIET